MYTQIICISVLYVHMSMHAAPLHVFLWEASGCLQATTARIPGLRYPFELNLARDAYELYERQQHPQIFGVLILASWFE